MLENLWKGGDNDRATVDWRWKSTQREVFDRCSRDSSPFSSLVPSFFFSSPVFSNHHHRKLSWSAKHFFPWIWMRADAWNEAGFVGWKLFNDRAKRQLELDGRGTHNHPLQLFTANFSDLLANLASLTHTHTSFSMSSIVQLNSYGIKFLRGIVLEGVDEGMEFRWNENCFKWGWNWSFGGFFIVIGNELFFVLLTYWKIISKWYESR